MKKLLIPLLGLCPVLASAVVVCPNEAPTFNPSLTNFITSAPAPYGKGSWPNFRFNAAGSVTWWYSNDGFTFSPVWVTLTNSSLLDATVIYKGMNALRAVDPVAALNALPSLPLNDPKLTTVYCQHIKEILANIPPPVKYTVKPTGTTYPNRYTYTFANGKRGATNGEIVQGSTCDCSTRIIEANKSTYCGIGTTPITKIALCETLVKTIVPPPAIVPAPVTPAQPPNETQVVACPVGSATGATWLQTRAYVAAPAPAYWTPGPWLPSTAPSGACPPAPDMHAGMHVDPATLPAPVLGVKDDRVLSANQFPATSAEPNSGQFRTVCYTTKYNWDDPIVYPGQPGKSHLHVFAGNDGIDAFSTLTSLRAGGSTCRGGTINQTSYWQPAMIDTRTAKLIPARTSILYYKTAVYSDPLLTKPFPEGFKMVAGDPTATGPVQYGPASFSCSGNQVGNDNSFPYVPDPRGPHTIPSMADCPVGNEIHTSVVFPSCWDGINIDAPDHRSHVIYNWPNNLGGKCPPTHPITIPQITIKFVYPILPGDDTRYWRLASDMYDATQPAGYSLHADWFNAWKPEFMQLWVDKCLVGMKDCQAHMLGDGRIMDSFNGN